MKRLVNLVRKTLYRLQYTPATHESLQGEREQAWLPRNCERLLDFAVVLLATWTVVYHICLILRLSVPWAVGLEVLTLVGAGVLLWWLKLRPGYSTVTPETSPGESPAVGSRPAVVKLSRLENLVLAVVLISGASAAMLVAAEAWWPLISALWLIAAFSGTVWAALRYRLAGSDSVEHNNGSGQTGAVVALAWGLALAVLSMFTFLSNPDDVYYVNLSQWVADRGTFPLRDTIFSNLAFPMSSWPPMASYDALVGTLARLGGVKAASIAYLGVPPVATFLSVLALWRLLQTWRVRATAVALSLALVFLLFDGGPGYAAPGNLFLTRLWQGKVILLCLLVPLLLVYALRYVEQPTKTRAGWLLAGGAAAVGLSTTAIFLVPLIALCGAAPLLFRRSVWAALLGFFAMAAYPLAAGAVTLAVDGKSADFFGVRKLFRFDPAWFGHEIFRNGPLALVAVFAVLVGALLVPHRAARVTTGLAVVIVGVTFVPGVTQLSYDLIGLGPTLWRVSWIASIAALVGVLGARLATSMRDVDKACIAPLALMLAIVLFGLPIWSGQPGVSLDTSLGWKRPIESIETAERVLDIARPGDVILAPGDTSLTIALLTTRVKTVAPRDYFMYYLRNDPDFHYDERMTLFEFANAGAVYTYEVASALSLLDVKYVCLPTSWEERTTFLRAEGYVPATSSTTQTCFVR